MKAKEYLREFKKKHGISDVWEQHELLKLMNEYDSTAVINENDLSHSVIVSVCNCTQIDIVLYGEPCKTCGGMITEQTEL
jgi:hypothetical protein